MKKKSIITAILAAVLAFALGGTTTWYVMDSQTNELKKNFESQQQSTDRLVQDLKKQVDELEGTSGEVSKVEPTKSTETADWKTYTNSKYGFSLKYSNDLNYQEYTISGTDSEKTIYFAKKQLPFSFSEGVLTFNNDYGVVLSIDIRDPKQYGGIDPEYALKKEVVNIAGISSQKLFFNNREANYSYWTAEISKNGKFFEFTSAEKNKTEFDKMLSTIRFTK